MKFRLPGSFALPAPSRFLLATAIISILPLPATAAQSVFWGNMYDRPDLYSEMPSAPPVRRPRPPVIPKGAEQAEKAAAQGKKPVGPLVIAVSIQRQNVRVYDANGLFAESPISSGMAGHGTPMGVFSVIQKNKHHRSNIYSGAPMPYMQRITWSGIALHAGVLPGYPASHGCIRMPMSFAMKMWAWTRMGARVIVAPGELSPATFAHPALAALNAAPALAEAPDAVSVKTADASNSLATKVMTDVATGSIAAAPETARDVAQVAAGATADAASDITPTATAENDGLPPIPAPATADFSDLGVEITTQETLVAEAPAPAASAPPAAAPALAVETTAAVSVQAATEAAPVVTPPPAAALIAQPLPLIKRNQPVAIFVSRKDARLYVRQNFKPVLDIPITIEAAEKPLGTHVFTASAGAGDERALHWSVVSLPATARQAAMIRDEHAKSKRAEVLATATSAPVPSAAEAMARIAIPQDLMTRLGEALPAGSSLVVSDQGIAQGETGEGTDFIVRLR